MNPRDAVNDDDQFSLLLARYNEVLSAGGEVDPSSFSSLSSQLQERLRRSLRCLHLLRQFPPSFTAAPTVVRKADITLHDGVLGGQVGRFRLLRRLGHGGGGIVFLAFDPDLQREVALKVPHLSSLLEPEMRRRFLREARAAARLDHPNLMPVHEAGESNGVCFLVSTYCRGGSLAQWLAARTLPVPARQAAELLADLAGAVQYIHDHGIYHRDIKPGNILLDPRTAPPGEPAFVPRLTDFGLAKLHEAQTESTRSGVVLGTLSYMAPEQVEGRVRDIGPATDVYGLGAVLYEVLAGRSPFRGATDADTLRQVLTEEPVPLRRIRRDVPLDLETICRKCFEKEPARRYASAADLARDLRRFLSGEPIRARPLGRIERLGKWVRRRPAKTILFALSLLLTLVLVGGSLLLASLKQTHDAELESAAKQREENQKDILEKERRLRQNRYADDIAQAWRSWENRRPKEIAHRFDSYRLPSGQFQTDDLRGFEWYYLSHLTHSGSRVSRYTSSLACVAFSPDGATCTTGHFDGAIVLWDTASGRPSAILKEHKLVVGTLAYSPDGSYLASGSESEDDARGELLLWDMRKRKVIRAFPDPLGSVHSVACSPDGRTLAAAIHLKSGSAAIKLWGMPTGEPRRNIPLPASRAAQSLAFTFDSATLALGHTDGTLSLCDPVTGRILETHPGHQNVVATVACGHKDAVLVSGAKDGRVRLWSLRPSVSLLAEYSHEGELRSVAFSPDDRSVASIGPKMLRVWDRDDRREHFSRPFDNWFYEPGSAVAFSPDGKTLAFGGPDGRLWIDNLSRSADGRLSMKDGLQTTETLSWLGHRAGTEPCEVWAVAFSPDSKMLASAGDDHKVRLWDPSNGREVAIFTGHRALVSCLAFSPDGQWLASGSFDDEASVKLWNVATGAKVATLRGHGKPVCTVAFAPNGKLLATAGRDRITRLWDLDTRKDQPILASEEIESLAFSPDGRTLALASQGQSLFLWDMAEKKIRRTLPPHPLRHVSVAFSPDGKTLATGDCEGTVRFWDADTVELRRRVRHHTDAVNCLAFSPDGKTLATAGFDKKVKLWQTATGRELLTFPEHKDQVRWLAFSPDGTMLATAGHDGILKIYRADSRDQAQASE